MKSSTSWPKKPPTLTENQLKAKAEFLKLWHEILPVKYGLIEKFNHESGLLRNSLKTAKIQSNGSLCKTMEIGAGLGEHIYHEDLTQQDYTALEIRDDFVDTIKKRFPNVKTMVGDIQGRLDLPDKFFDRILAIHVLEHLRNLPSALVEIKRLLKPSGKFIVVIPCEGGVAYQLARRISAQRVFEKKFNIPYGPIIKNEHCNKAEEILAELHDHFEVEESSYWPLMVPITQINLVIALVCRHKNS